jgi:hypothetical protein
MRNLKHVALALVGAFAIGAIAASVASANQFHSTEAETASTVASNEDQKYLYETGGKTVKCTGIGGSGETKSATVSEAPFAPQYSGCTVDGIAFSSAEVSMGECKVIVTIEATKNEGVTHVSCQGTSQVTITVKVFGVSVCTFHIGKQSPKGFGIFSNNGTTQVKIKANLTGIVGSKQGGSECGSATSTTGTVTATTVIKGVKTGTQTQTSVQVS